MQSSNSLRALQSEKVANLGSFWISMGKHRVFQLLLQYLYESYFFTLFLPNASPIQFSQGMVICSTSTCLEESDTRTKSGLSVVTAMVSGNLSCFPSCQLWADDGTLMDFCTAVDSLLSSQKQWSVLLVFPPCWDSLCNDSPPVVSLSYALGQQLLFGPRPLGWVSGCWCQDVNVTLPLHRPGHCATTML